MNTEQPERASKALGDLILDGHRMQNELTTDMAVLTCLILEALKGRDPSLYDDVVARVQDLDLPEERRTRLLKIVSAV